MPWASLPKGPKQNDTEHYEIYKHYKQSPTNILNDQIHYKSHISQISGSLKNLKPEKIGLRAKFNRHIHVLVTPKFGEAQWI